MSVGRLSFLRARVRLRRFPIALGLGALLIVPGSIGALTGSDRAAEIARNAAHVWVGGWITVMMASGWLGRDLKTDAYLYWLQSARSPLGLIARRQLSLLFASMLLVETTHGMGLAISALIGGGSLDGGTMSGVVSPAIVALHTSMAVTVWNVGSWSVRADGIVGSLVWMALCVLELLAKLGPEWMDPVRSGLDLVGLPLDQIPAIDGLVIGSSSAIRAAITLGLWAGALWCCGFLKLSRSLSRECSRGERGV